MAEPEKTKPETKATVKEEPKPGESAPLHGADEPNGAGIKFMMEILTGFMGALGIKLGGAMDGPDNGLGNAMDKLMGIKHEEPAATAPVAAMAPPTPAAPGRH
jgi:hypothetical protein